MNESSKHLSTPMGIHRLLKEPYDDREVFTSIDNLKEYCRNGACYDGQRVACIIGTPNKGGYIQDFVIYNKMAIAKFNNGEIITYNDPTYGNVRIVAGDPQYPYGTIIRISNTKAGDFNAIVLDRGGDIGIGRRFLFDLLFPSESEAAAFGTSYDVTVDVLRFGY